MLVTFPHFAQYVISLGYESNQISQAEVTACPSAKEGWDTWYLPYASLSYVPTLDKASAADPPGTASPGHVHWLAEQSQVNTSRIGSAVSIASAHYS